MKVFQDRIPFLGQDPFVGSFEGCHYFIESQDESRIAISRLTLTPTPQRYATQVVWSNPRDKQLWAPELHHIEDHWYIYYASSDGHNACHRTHALRSTDDNPLGPYRYAGQIGPDIWAIDLTTFTHNHHHYACWSGWETNTAGPQHLYIAPMSSPTALASHRVKLASPQLPWEQSHAPILEGPQAFTSNGQLTLTYAANASWTQDYATGVLILTSGTSDPLDPQCWSKWPHPLATNCGHGHVIPDTDLFIYHKKLSALHGWSDRVIDTMKVQDLFNYEH